MWLLNVPFGRISWLTYSYYSTGNAPYKCSYCDEHFQDPSRRQRHMIGTHNHRMSRRKKGRIVIDVSTKNNTPPA